MGSYQGDRLLQQVAQRLREQVSPNGSLARLGNDEFGIALPCSKGLTEAIVQIEQLRTCFAQPYYLNGKELYVTASIGVARYPSDSKTDQDLLPQAETALKRAKQQGANSYRLFDQETTALLQERLQLETDLRSALTRQQFRLKYQPRVHLPTQKIVGVEALLRWQHPTLGMISPAKFITIAEETGLIEEIGLWVLRTACQQQKQWEENGFPNIKISVNLSARQLEQDSLISQIDKILTETAIDPRCLELEVTESFFTQDMQKAQALLNQLSAREISLALDDFGTGYASLSYLRQLPFDCLKIDRSFVQDVVTDDEAASIARTIMSLGQNLKLNLVAEGIETQPQLDYFQGHYCDEVQGYFFSPPAEAADILQLLQSQ